MDMQISNENIIFIYLNTKNEIIILDHKLKQFNIFCDEMSKKFQEELKSGKFTGELGMLQALAKLSGQEISSEQIREIGEKKMKELEEKTKKAINYAINKRLSILDELQLAFDVLKDEMPDIVEKYSKDLTDPESSIG